MAERNTPYFQPLFLRSGSMAETHENVVKKLGKIKGYQRQL